MNYEANRSKIKALDAARIKGKHPDAPGVKEALKERRLLERFAIISQAGYLAREKGRNVFQVRPMKSWAEHPASRPEFALKPRRYARMNTSMPPYPKPPGKKPGYSRDPLH